MATDVQLAAAEQYVREHLPAKFAEVLIEGEGFGVLAHGLTIKADQSGQTPEELLLDLVARAEDPEDDEVAPLARIASFTAPAAYVYSRLSF